MPRGRRAPGVDEDRPPAGHRLARPGLATRAEFAVVGTVSAALFTVPSLR
jgi:hypothetical protein